MPEYERFIILKSGKSENHFFRFNMFIVLCFLLLGVLSDGAV